MPMYRSGSYTSANPARQQCLLRPRRVVDEQVEVAERPQDGVRVESRDLRSFQERILSS